MPNDPNTITAAAITRNFGYWQQRALQHRLTITHHGRERVMLVSKEEFETLSQVAQSQTSLSKDREVDLVLANMNEGFIAFDGDLRVLKANPVAETYFGVRPGDLVGMTYSQIQASPSDTVIAELLRRVIRSGEAINCEINSDRFATRRIDCRAIPYLDGVALLFTNISEREVLRRRTQEGDAFKAALSDTPSVGWLKLDAHGRVTDGGGCFEAITGFSVQTLKSFRLFDIIRSSDRRRVQAAYDDLLANWERTGFEAWVACKNGDDRRLHLSLAPVIQDHACVGALVVVSDCDPANGERVEPEGLPIQQARRG